jgi:hypothetical protein
MLKNAAAEAGTEGGVFSHTKMWVGYLPSFTRIPRVEATISTNEHKYKRTSSLDDNCLQVNKAVVKNLNDSLRQSQTETKNSQVII